LPEKFPNGGLRYPPPKSFAGEISKRLNSMISPDARNMRSDFIPSSLTIHHHNCLENTNHCHNCLQNKNHCHNCLQNKNHCHNCLQGFLRFFFLLCYFEYSQIWLNYTFGFIAHLSKIT
jgi:hypothetical protein